MVELNILKDRTRWYFTLTHFIEFNFKINTTDKLQFNNVWFFWAFNAFMLFLNISSAICTKQTSKKPHKFPFSRSHKTNEHFFQQIETNNLFLLFLVTLISCVVKKCALQDLNMTQWHGNETYLYVKWVILVECSIENLKK